MDEIAEAAGVTKPVLYQHFPTKRALYRELLDDVDAPAARPARGGDRAARRAAASGSRQGFAAYFRFVADEPRRVPAAVRRVGAQRSRVRGRRRAPRSTASPTLIASLIEIDAPPEHRQVLAHAIVGMAEATSRRLTNDDAEDDPDRLAGWLAEMAWFGSPRRARRRAGRAPLARFGAATAHGLHHSGRF